MIVKNFCQLFKTTSQLLRDTFLQEVILVVARLLYRLVSLLLSQFYEMILYIESRDERKIVAQLWKTTIWGCFCQKIVLWLGLWCSLSKNVGSGWGCGGKNLKIVVVVRVGVVVFGKIVLWLWCSLSENCGRGWGCGG